MWQWINFCVIYSPNKYSHSRTNFKLSHNNIINSGTTMKTKPFLKTAATTLSLCSAHSCFLVFLNIARLCLLVVFFDGISLKFNLKIYIYLYIYIYIHAYLLLFRLHIYLYKSYFLLFTKNYYSKFFLNVCEIRFKKMFLNLPMILKNKISMAGIIIIFKFKKWKNFH